MVTRTRLNITFIRIVYCLSCNIPGKPAHGLTDWPKHVAVRWYISANKEWYCARYVIIAFTATRMVETLRLLRYTTLAYLLTYLLTYSMQQSSSWEANGFQLVKKFPAFYGTRRFITAFTSARQLSLSWGSSIQSMSPHPTSCISILISSSHLRLGLPSGLLHSGFPTKSLYTPRLSPICATCPAHLILFDFYHPNNIMWGV